MTTRLLVGDVFARMAELPDHSFDLIVTSPPFLCLRSYLPDDHPDKDKEIGSEATPADYLDTLLRLSAEWRRLLAPHGSIAVELGDTYAGSGGGGGDYLDGGWREGQQQFSGSGASMRESKAAHWRAKNRERDAWPLDKSLTGIPTLYAWSLAYGRNLLTGQESPAGRWRVRNVKPWIRSNPPVGALGTLNARERSATSYVTVACTGDRRFFDLDAVRTPAGPSPYDRVGSNGERYARRVKGEQPEGMGSDAKGEGSYGGNNAGGAPPLDWWHPVDAVIDNIIDQKAGKPNNHNPIDQPTGGTYIGRGGDELHRNTTSTGGSVGARGVHIRRALTQAGHLPPGDFYDVSPKGYAGAHYAVWPPELVRLLIDEMCPRQVCTKCGEPSRRIETAQPHSEAQAALAHHIEERREAAGLSRADLVPLLLLHYKNAESVTAQVSNWERAKNVPAPRDWELLKEKLGVSAAFDPYIYGDRKWTESTTEHVRHGTNGAKSAAHREGPSYTHRATAVRSDLGWSDCGHGAWRPGRILDPFSGSGTTLAVASGMGRDSVGIDLDPRNADLTAERVGMFLEVDYGTREATA